MKKINTIALLGLLISYMSCENNANAPQKVKDAFAEKFPSATDVAWEKESDKEWEAEFKLHGKKQSSNFMQDGTWTETECEVSKSEIPQVVMDALNVNFEGYNIGGMELSETTKGKVYEFSIEKGESDMEVVIDSKGIVIKKELDKEDKNNNDADDMHND